jgi:hypothetical protein
MHPQLDGAARLGTAVWAWLQHAGAEQVALLQQVPAAVQQAGQQASGARLLQLAGRHGGQRDAALDVSDHNAAAALASLQQLEHRCNMLLEHDDADLVPAEGQGCKGQRWTAERAHCCNSSAQCGKAGRQWRWQQAGLALVWLLDGRLLGRYQSELECGQLKAYALKPQGKAWCCHVEQTTAVVAWPALDVCIKT